MKNSEVSVNNAFSCHLRTFKMLINGSKMAKVSSIFLILASLVLAFNSIQNLEQVIPLLLGALAIVIYVFKYLTLRDKSALNN